MASQTPAPAASSPSPSITRRYGIIWSKQPFSPTSSPAAAGSAQQHKEREEEEEDNYGEPTSTIVTSSPSGQFVDIRLMLKQPVTKNAHTAPAPATLEPGTAFASLEWAIAGQATYSTLPDGRKHGKWSHWVSSLGGSSSGGSSPTEEDPADEGDMQTDPVTGRVVETGQMRNLASGEVEWYKEVWGDVSIKMPDPVPGAAVAGEPNRWTAGGQAERQKVAHLAKGKRSYVVVKCEHEDRKVRGLIVWAGQYCQGVLKEEDGKVTAERWEYDFVPNGGHGEWVRTFRTGKGSLPCGWLVKESDGIKRGETLCAPKLLGDRDRWIIVDEDFTAPES